jgi:ribosomal-protein-alanine N-acetyltransferase
VDGYTTNVARLVLAPVRMRCFTNFPTEPRHYGEVCRDHGFGQWVVLLRSSGEFVGQCGLTAQEEEEGEKEIEIGYLLLRKFWGRGFATEAAIAARDYGFHTFGYERLVSLIDTGNRASRRVAEKVGLTLEKKVWKWNKMVCVYAINKGSVAT